MAKQKEAAAEVVEEQPKRKGKKKLLIILGVVLVVLVAGAAALFLLLPNPNGRQGPVAAESAPPIYVSLQSFTVNLADGDSYLQIEIKLLIANNDFQEKLKQRMPEVRNDILRILSSKTPDQLSTSEGKDKLAADIKADINGLLKVQPNNGVKEVLFGAFLIQ